MDKIWVLAEQQDGSPLGTVLELLSAARGLASTVEAITYGKGASDAALVLGEHGATRVFDAGDLGDSLPGPACQPPSPAWSSRRVRLKRCS